MSQSQRGPHPADHELFAVAQHDRLRQAVAHQSWLLSHGYTPVASLKLVGDHFNLRERQRLAVARAACSDAQRETRQRKALAFAELAGRALLLDGFNLVVTLEAALSGGVLLHCRDGCWRDMSSVHGSYRSVQSTDTALELLGEMLAAAQPAAITWLLDQPVSNSGRLAQRIRELAEARNWDWQVEVVMNPDKDISTAKDVALTSDSNILDHVSGWFNATEFLLQKRLPSVWTVDLRASVADEISRSEGTFRGGK